MTKPVRILLFKSQIRAYTTKHGVFVPAHTDKRTARSLQSGKDHHTHDMFKPNVRAGGFSFTWRGDVVNDSHLGGTSKISQVAEHVLSDILSHLEDFNDLDSINRVWGDKFASFNDMAEALIVDSYSGEGDIAKQVASEVVAKFDFSKAVEEFANAFKTHKQGESLSLAVAASEKSPKELSPSERGVKFSVPSNGVAVSNTKIDKDGIETAVPAGVRTKKYYVTMIRDPGANQRVARLAGPFDTYEEALAHVEPARKHAEEVDPRAAWDAFGTAGIESDNHKPGTLNEKMGIGASKSEERSAKQDADELRGYLNGDDLRSAIDQLTYMDYERAREVLLRAGFAIPSHKAKSTRSLIVGVQDQLLQASKRWMVKSTQPRILFLKSHVKQFTRKDGTVVKEHDDKRAKQMQAAPVAPAPAQEDAPANKPAAQAPESSSYGHHNVEEGDSLKFKAGDFAGSGKVKLVGKDGATVTDNSGRDHQVHWNEVTGRGGDKAAPDEKNTPAEAAKPTEAEEPAKEAQKGDADGKVIGKIDGNAARRAKAEDIARALFDTSETDSLPKTAAQSEEFDSWEKIEAGAPQALKEFKGMLGKVAKTLDLETGKRPATFDFAQEEENSKAKEKGKEAEKLDPADYMTPEHWDSDRGFLFIGPLKSKDRAEAKVKADYTNKDTGDEEWYKLKDMVRATIAVPSITQIPKVLAEMKKAGIVLAQKPKNNLTGEGLHGTGYRDVNLIVKMPNGMLAELQIHVKAITQAKEQGHKPYAANAAISRQYESSDEKRDTWTDEHKDEHDENSVKMKRGYDKAWDKSIGHSDEDISAPTLQKSLTKPMMVLLKVRRVS